LPDDLLSRHLDADVDVVDGVEDLMRGRSRKLSQRGQLGRAYEALLDLRRVLPLLLQGRGSLLDLELKLLLAVLELGSLSGQIRSHRVEGAGERLDLVACPDMLRLGVLPSGEPLGRGMERVQRSRQRPGKPAG